jgi:hypothetical protein
METLHTLYQTLCNARVTYESLTHNTDGLDYARAWFTLHQAQAAYADAYWNYVGR